MMIVLRRTGYNICSCNIEISYKPAQRKSTSLDLRYVQGNNNLASMATKKHQFTTTTLYRETRYKSALNKWQKE